MQIKLEIETQDNKLLNDLFEWKNDKWQPVSFEGDATARYDGSIASLAEGVPTVIVVLVTFVTAVAAEVVANWIYDKIAGRASGLKIERTEVQMDRNEIRKIIIEKIEESQ